MGSNRTWLSSVLFLDIVGYSKHANENQGIIKNHFNYGSCMTNHANNPNFSGQTWRVFLGKGWEMWADKYEVVSLFDQFGRLVTEKTY